MLNKFINLKRSALLRENCKGLFMVLTQAGGKNIKISFWEFVTKIQASLEFEAWVQTPWVSENLSRIYLGLDGSIVSLYLAGTNAHFLPRNRLSAQDSHISNILQKYELEVSKKNLTKIQKIKNKNKIKPHWNKIRYLKSQKEHRHQSHSCKALTDGRLRLGNESKEMLESREGETQTEIP